MTKETAAKPKNDLLTGSVRIPYWLTCKAVKERISWEQLAVYCWIYDHNAFSIRKEGTIYGCITYHEYHLRISKDLCISVPRKPIKKLIEAKWLAQSRAGVYNDRPTKGYRCLLDARQREDVRVEQQELTFADEHEDNATIVESILPPQEMPQETPQENKKIFRYCGEYWYEEDGEKIYIPQAAAEQAAAEHIPSHYVYDFEADRWCAPEDLTDRPVDPF